MSVVSRMLLAALVCASAGIVQVAPTVANAQAAAKPTDGAEGDTRGRFMHASKCVMTFGLTSGCDKDAPAPKAEQRKAEAGPAAAPDNSTKSQFFRASRCVVSLGFAGNCDKNAPAGEARAAPTAEAGRRAEAAPDTSTKGQFLKASRCVVSLGFAGNCDKNAPGGEARAASSPAPKARAEAPPAEADASTKGQFLHASKCVMSLGFLGNCDKK